MSEARDNRQAGKHMSDIDSDHWPDLQVILNLIPTSWRVGLHWSWERTRTVVVDLGPVTVAYCAEKRAEAMLDEPLAQWEWDLLQPNDLNQWRNGRAK